MLTNYWTCWQIRKNSANRNHRFSSSCTRIRNSKISRSIFRCEKQTTNDEEREESSYWYENEKNYRHRERTNVQQFNIATILAIWTRADEDDYVKWNCEFEDSACCSSSWFSLEQKTRQKTRQKARQKMKAIIISKTTRSRTKTSSVERDLIDTLKQMMLNAKMLSIVFVSSSWKSWKSWKKKLFFREEKFFFRNANSISTIACSNRDKRELSYLIRLADVNVIEEWC
jgi:hypothetical protein